VGERRVKVGWGGGRWMGEVGDWGLGLEDLRGSRRRSGCLGLAWVCWFVAVRGFFGRGARLLLGNLRYLFDCWVKDFAGPCDCIKDSDGSRPVKKTRIDSTPSANPNSLRVLERVDASKCK